jgi:hypothetical protein
LESNKSLTPGNTLVGFNITGIDRSDVICSPDHPAINDILVTGITEGVEHPSKRFGFGWITGGIRSDMIHIFNCILVVQAISYLEANNFNYFFMLMNSEVYDYAPDWFQNFLQQREQWVKFENFNNMFEFLKYNALISPDGHPTRSGHRLIAEHILNFLHNHGY